MFSSVSAGFFCSSVTNPCSQSLLSLPWIYWGSTRERWNEVIYFVCRCLAVNWVLVVPLLILWHVAVPGWVLLPSVCLVEFLNMILWVAIHPETGMCAFSKFTCFLSFQIFPPLIPLYQSVFVRALQGWKWALVKIITVRYSGALTPGGWRWIWAQLCAFLLFLLYDFHIAWEKLEFLFCVWKLWSPLCVRAVYDSCC